jgi:hypothetical protein
MSLEQLIADAYERTGDMDVRLLSAEVAAAVPSRELRATLESVLPKTIAEWFRWNANVNHGGHGFPTSQRWKDFRTGQYETIEYVPGVGRMKFGDLTPEHCEAIAQDRFEQAGKLEAAGKRYLDFAGEMRRHGAATIRDLPEEGAA